MTKRLLGGGLISAVTIYFLFYIMNELSFFSGDLFDNKNFVVGKVSLGFNVIENGLNSLTDLFQTILGIWQKLKSMFLNDLFVLMADALGLIAGVLESIFGAINKLLDFFEIDNLKEIAQQGNWWQQIVGYLEGLIIFK